MYQISYKKTIKMTLKSYWLTSPHKVFWRASYSRPILPGSRSFHYSCTFAVHAALLIYAKKPIENAEMRRLLPELRQSVIRKYV
jgi:hypothetical protein